ncbi:MAG: hypothetical protein AAB734_04560 [Patescibacteria group bacterium]
MKTAILVHGHFLGTPDWERVVWGNPAHGVYGNVPKGLVEALRFDADTILFGTGASEKDGLNEGEYALKLARERWREIPEFKSKDAGDVKAWLERCAVIESTAQNTPQEIVAGAQIARGRGAVRLIQIACRTHSPRALRTAISVLSANEDIRFFLDNFYSVTSDSKYDNGDIDDVVVIEPPHRPDRPHVFFNKTALMIVGHMNDARAQELDTALKSTIDEYRKTT